MKFKHFILFFILTTTVSFGQEIVSKGDKYFYSYAYEAAIQEYQKQMREGTLISNEQLLNLADSYYQTRDYLSASKIYKDVNRKDSIMSDFRFNKMLQSLAKINENEQILTLLKSRKASLANELLENATFNYEVLRSNMNPTPGLSIFKLRINTEFADFSPAFFKNKILFSSARKSKSKRIYGPSGESYLDIYVALREGDGNLLNANVFDGVPESPFHKSTPFYSEGEGHIYYVLSNLEGKRMAFDENGKNALAIGMAYENGFFRFLLKDLSTSFYYPFYEEKSERLYFSANFEDSYGGTDIYYVNTNRGQIMSQPINLGPRINTPGNEIAPYIYDNSLYFSSDVFYGNGGMDIYRSNILSDRNFSIPVNLGEEINTKHDEFGFIIKDEVGEGLLGYFSSNRPGGKGKDDIYGYKIQEKPGLRTIFVRGTVVQPQYDQPILDASVKLLAENGKILKETRTKADGSYHIEIPYTDIVTVEISRGAYSTYRKTYDTKTLDQLLSGPLKVELVSIDNLVEEREEKTVLDIDDFFFATGKSDVGFEVQPALDEVVAAIKKFPKIKISIRTHTDSKGGKNANKKLSQARADNIKAYLLQSGVSSNNIISSIGYGEDLLVNQCSDGVYCLDFLHKQNLRTLFVVENFEELNK